MRYLSVCSGIEAATVAWHPLGWTPVAFAEIERFPSAVLAHHYPDVPNLGDITQFKDWPDATVDLLVGGTPCQSFSVAGLRQGLADPRGNLALTYLAIAERHCPRWVVWENVPGVLSSDERRALGAFLGALGELGYGWAYRSLDAQYFHLAQRRERVFVVGHLGDWRGAAAVLLERESLSGHPAPSRDTWKDDPAGTLGSAHGNIRADEAWTNRLIAKPLLSGGHANNPLDETLIAKALNAKGGSGRIDAESETFVAHALRADGFDASEDGTGRGTPLVAFQARASSRNTMNPSAVAPTLDKGKAEGVSVQYGMRVRRLTPRECERLQGFPDDYTLIPYRGKSAKDGPRYKALGNSMAVPVMRWIGNRIAMVNALTEQVA